LNQLNEKAESTLLPDYPVLAEYYDWLQNQLGGTERFEHSLGVAEASVALAQGFGFSTSFVEKALIADFLHDAAKLMTPAKLFAAADDFQLGLDEWDRATPQTVHPFVGAALVQQTFNIRDPDILNAIRYHTTGRTGMSALEKIVYIADKTEKRTRNPEYIAEMTAALDFNQPETLNITLLKILDATLLHLLQKGFAIHPRTLAARNDVLIQLKSV